MPGEDQGGEEHLRRLPPQTESAAEARRIWGKARPLTTHTPRCSFPAATWRAGGRAQPGERLLNAFPRRTAISPFTRSPACCTWHRAVDESQEDYRSGLQDHVFPNALVSAPTWRWLHAPVPTPGWWASSGVKITPARASSRCKPPNCSFRRRPLASTALTGAKTSASQAFSR